MKTSLVVYVVMLLCHHILMAQTPPKAVVDHSESFLNVFEAQDHDLLKTLLPNHEINVLGQIWMIRDNVIGMIQSAIAPKFSSFTLNAIFGFTECIADTLFRRHALNAQRVFDNHSYMSLAFADEHRDRGLGLVYQQVDSVWEIACVFMFPPISMVMSNESKVLNRFREYDILDSRVSIHLPPGFEVAASREGYTNIALMRGGVRQATFDCVLDSVDFSSAPKDVSDPMCLVASRFNERYVTSRYPHSDQ